MENGALFGGRLSINHCPLGENAPALRLVHFTDVHARRLFPAEKLGALAQAINALRPDVAVFTGDLFDRYARYPYAEAIAQVLAGINAPLGKLAVWGNHDRRAGGGAVLPAVLAKAGFRLLVNETVLIRAADGKTVLFGGLDDALRGAPDIAGLAERMLRERADYKILLLHEPDLADEFPPGTADLLLAGHSHAGQIRLPWFAPCTTWLGRRYVRGFYTINGMRLYVNSGVGTTMLPLRIFAPPELAVWER